MTSGVKRLRSYLSEMSKIQPVDHFLCPCFGFGPLVPVMRTLKVTAQNNIFNNSVSSSLFVPFLFQNDDVPMHKNSSIKTWLSKFGVVRTDSLTSPAPLGSGADLEGSLKDAFPPLLALQFWSVLVQNICMKSRGCFC